MRVITLEEHFWTRDLADPPGTDFLGLTGSGSLDERLIDLGEQRIAAMDAAGIDVQVISHTTPAAQQLPTAEAVAEARAANDVLADAVAAHPDRFFGFATLPTTDPHAAAEELSRAVGEYGFVGAMINDTFGTDYAFLDDPRYGVLLERAERLDVPIYLHPSLPPPQLDEILYRGLTPPYDLLLRGGAFGWHAMAGLHALRLVVNGVFDRHPNLRLILGHCGEMIPIMLGRIDDVLRPERTGLDAVPSDYFLRHVWVTTSGMFTVPPVRCALDVFGVERVMFSVDYPYSSTDKGKALLDQLGDLGIGAAAQARVAGGNAEALLKLGPERAGRSA